MLRKFRSLQRCKSEYVKSPGVPGISDWIDNCTIDGMPADKYLDQPDKEDTGTSAVDMDLLYDEEM
jgi:hypothetical protein